MKIELSPRKRLVLAVLVILAFWRGCEDSRRTPPTEVVRREAVPIPGTNAPATPRSAAPKAPSKAKPAPKPAAKSPSKHGYTRIGGEPRNKPFRAETSRKTVKRPKMPLLPTAKGKLSGLVVILDAGHGGTDPGAGWTETFDGKPVRFWEAGYTYRMVGELNRMLRARGATVYLTGYSSVMDDESTPPAQVPLPLPRDAVMLYDGSGSTAQRWRNRVKYIKQVCERHPGDAMVSLSLHIDSMSDKWKGGHICIAPRVAKKPPQIAKVLAAEFVEIGMGRKKNGKLHEPLDARGLYIVRQNPCPESVLIELGVPQNANDSFRLRSTPHRLKLLRTIRDGIIEARRRGLRSA